MSAVTNPEALTKLLPCPFCGAGTTLIEEYRIWTGMEWGKPHRVAVRHWCDPIEAMRDRVFERSGHDLEAAIRAWNTRA